MTKYRATTDTKKDCDAILYGLDQLGITYTVTSKMGNDTDTYVFMDKGEPHMKTGRWRIWFIEVNLGEAQ